MAAIFSVDKMRGFFSVKVMYNVFKRMKLVLYMYLITISMSEVYSDCINQLSTFFFKGKKIPPIQIIVTSALSIWIH